jgi:hypothetical protein
MWLGRRQGAELLDLVAEQLGAGLPQQRHKSDKTGPEPIDDLGKPDIDRYRNFWDRHLNTIAK